MKSGTMGESSKEGEKDDGVRLDVGVGVGVGVGVAANMNSEGEVEPMWFGESDTKTKFDCVVCAAAEEEPGVAGFGAMGRCFVGWGCVGGLLRDGEEEVREEDLESPGFRLGKVSARSTIVLNWLIDPSHAISVLTPEPELMIVRAMTLYILSRVFPAYTFGSPWSWGEMFFSYIVNAISHSSKQFISCA